jgi:hypothetical protein
MGFKRAINTLAYSSNEAEERKKERGEVSKIKERKKKEEIERKNECQTNCI